MTDPLQPSFQSLEPFGWTERLSRAFADLRRPKSRPARVLLQQRGRLRLVSSNGEEIARISGGLRHRAGDSGDLPAVGDWVVIGGPIGDVERPARVVGVLPRSGAFARKVVGEVTDRQVVAANLDTVFVVAGLDGDFNLRRIERFVAFTWESGAQPVVLLTKADLRPAAEVLKVVAEVEEIALGVSVLAISVLDAKGLEAVEALLEARKTYALLGASGVGKSTLLNHFLGRLAQRTAAVRGTDDRGRHTTTQRELFLLEGGAMVIDTPGMRELQVWGADEGIEATFEDVEQVAANCRFRDCGHEGEPGCAVEAAVGAGELEPSRVASWHKLRGEQEVASARQDEARKLRGKRDRNTIRNALMNKAVKLQKPRRFEDS